MTTSGTSDFNPAATFIITSAYRKLSAIDENEQPTAGMFQDALYVLNSLTKSWMASGIHVWTEEEAVLFLEPGQKLYLLGGTTTANTSDANSYVQATLASSAVQGSTSIVLQTSAGILVSQNIGIVLDDNTTQWTVVTSIVSNTVHFAAALTDSASAGNYAFAYTTKIVRPLKVPRVRRLQYNGSLETPMNMFSRKEYMNLPNKSTQGPPTAFFYAPKLVSGEFYVWPVPIDSSMGVRMTWYRPIQDFNNVDDTADMPQEWINALTWNLALQLAPDYDIPPARFSVIQGLAAQELELVQGWDRESEPIYFTVGYDETQRWGGM